MPKINTANLAFKMSQNMLKKPQEPKLKEADEFLFEIGEFFIDKRIAKRMTRSHFGANEKHSRSSPQRKGRV